MPIDFAKLTVQDGKKLVAYTGPELAILQTNREFVRGNHWQNRLGWIGPWQHVPEGSTEVQARKVTWLQSELTKGFISINAIGEGIDRNESGTVGIEPRWGFAPSEIELPENAQPGSPAAEEAKKRAEGKVVRAEAIATRWWDRNSGHAHLQDAARHLLYGAGTEAEIAGRFYIPAAFLEETTDANGIKTRALRIRSIEDAADKIRFEVLDADQGRVVRDTDTLAEIGIKPTTRGANQEQEVLEVTYLDSTSDAERPMTVIQTIAATSSPSVRLDLGGRLTMMTVTRKAFITEQIRQSQRALNFTASMVKRNVETAGFLRDTILNGELPGHYEKQRDGSEKWVLDPIADGPLSMNVFSGHEIKDKDDNIVGYTTPVLDHRQPVDPTPTIKAKQEHYADILRGFKQLHVLISGDATTSGESRVQARADHVSELRITQAPIERLGRWMIETVVMLANALVIASSANPAEKNTILDGLRSTFSCYLDPGPVAPSERAQNLAEMKEGALSKTTTIERNGIVDVDAELARVDSEPAAGLDAEQKRAAIYKDWIAGGVSEEFAAKRAGLSPKEIEELKTARTDTTAVTQ